MNRKQRYETITEYFRREMPNVTSELEFGSTFQLLVAVILSAQCTDKRVNMITPALFRDYPTADAMSKADETEIYEYVRSVSYPNAKAKHLVEMARMLVSDFNSEVPSTLEELIRLPGIGRKTANVVQAVAFGKSAMAVDTHIYRVSHRLGLVRKTDNNPYKVELELKKNFAEQDIPDAHHWLLLHGRYTCTSLKPKCASCPFDSFCPKRLENSKLR